MERELIVRWKVSEGAIDEVLSLLPEIAEKTRQEPGNVLYHIYQSEENPAEIILHERYADEDAVQAHKFSEHYRKIVFEKIIPLLENREVITVKQLY
jgi:(4S)-4-hydroxy-5-phosphonooxypentane-2,3-dione isomerase